MEMEAVMQMELFPSANEDEIKYARLLLYRYARMRNAVNVLNSRATLTVKEKKVLEEYQRKTEGVELAISMIIEDDVRKVMEFRFIRGNTRWGTVKRFSSITDRSIDRRVVKGVKSVAETLK
ncbi:hypothetical protein, partial [Streptomyces virens]|uniref:hypothetical protein n=1 Tax=Streptomyces virens TaxID=285572 RepID=UPI0031F99820